MKTPTVRRILNTKPTVRYYLKMNPALRDDDEKLIARIWFDTLKLAQHNPNTTSVKTFLTLMAERKITLISADDITRARRHLQEREPELRGLTWNERHGKSEDVKKHINDKELDNETDQKVD